MAKKYYGSLNFTKMLNGAKEGNPAYIVAGERNHIFADVVVWVNDRPDQYGNMMSVQVNAGKDHPELSFYVGNLKEGAALSRPLEPDELYVDETNFPIDKKE